MRSVQVSKPNAPLEIVEKDIPEPGARQVRIKVEACGTSKQWCMYRGNRCNIRSRRTWTSRNTICFQDGF
jgi:Zn-dependent alcohol dehydrogenase